MPRGQKGLSSEDMEKIMEKLEKLDILQKGLEDLKKGQDELKADFVGIKKDLKTVQQVAEENKQRVGGLEGEVRAIQKVEGTMQNEMLDLQLERMSFFLRFQNVEEKDGEDLRAVMTKMLAEYIERDTERMGWDMDQIYRVNSFYAKAHGVPREVHVKFLRRETRDEIIRTQRGGALIYRDKEINILKQIPRQVRNLRRKYFFLSNKLYLNGIMFRWLMPEGLMIFWEGNRHKINTIEEAKTFENEHKALLEGRGTEEGEVEVEHGEVVGAEAMEASGGKGEAAPRAQRSKVKKK